MEIKVVCCGVASCRRIIDRRWFEWAVLPDGQPNLAQGRCHHCGSRFLTEGDMTEDYERMWKKGEVHPKISQVGGVLVDDPFQESGPSYFLPLAWERKA